MSPMNIAMMSREPASSSTTSGPLLVFVLGAPCSGKSTFCAALAKSYNLNHFSLGDDLRLLISDTPSGHAARIKTRFSELELETFRNNLYAGTLGPAHLTPKYVTERVFPTGCNSKRVRMLIDDFPRDAERWVMFKERIKPFWSASARGVLVVLGVDREVALERFKKRGRPGESFAKRFDEHTRMTSDIVEAMREDGILILHVGKDELGNSDVEACVGNLADLTA